MRRRLIPVFLGAGGDDFSAGYGVTSGLHAHYNADQSGYADGASITTVPDLSGNGRDLSRTGTSGNPTFVANQINGRGVFRTATTNRFDAASFFDATIAANGTMIGIFRIGTANAELAWDNTASWWFNTGVVSPQGIKVFPSATSPGGVGKTYLGKTHFLFTYRWGNATSPYLLPLPSGHMDWNQNPKSTGTGASAAGRTLQMPRSGQIEFAEAIFWNRRLTWTEVFQVTNRMGLNPPSEQPGVVITIGNSTFTEPSRTFPDQFGSLSPPPAMFGFGYSGGNLTTTINQTTEIMEIVNYFCGIGKKAILVIHPGHNDNYGGTTSAATNTVWRHLTGADGTTLFSAARAAGAKVLHVTPSCWHGGAGGPGGKSSTIDGYRTWLNSEIIANSVSGGYADAVSDLGGSAEFGVYDPDIASPTPGSSYADYTSLWADQVHHTIGGATPGEVRKAEIVGADIVTLWNA